MFQTHALQTKSRDVSVSVCAQRCSTHELIDGWRSATDVRWPATRQWQYCLRIAQGRARTAIQPHGASVTRKRALRHITVRRTL